MSEWPDTNVPISRGSESQCGGRKEKRARVRKIASHDTHSAVIQNFSKSGRKYWATRSSAHSFAHTSHSLACSALLASLARSAALFRSHRLLTHSLPSSWCSGIFLSNFQCVLNHGGMTKKFDA